MSDFCDSLEDDAWDKISLDSLENVQTTSPLKTDNTHEKEFTFRLQEPFHLHNKNLDADKNNLFPIFIDCLQTGSSETSVNSHSKSSFSNSNNKIADTIRTNNEDELLIKKGLQRNIDGSFSKSPHQNVENDLPFVSKEFKNLSFQRKKSNDSKKCAKKLDSLVRKTSFSFSENSKDLGNMLSLIGHRLEKGSSEEVLTSRGSRSRGETDITHYKVEDNLTDSMKEELIRTLQKDQFGMKKKRFKSNQKLLNSASETKNLEKIQTKNFLKSNEDILIRERSKAFTKTNHLRCEILKNEEVIIRQNSGRKHKSDIVLPSIIKPGLSYLERYQKENGFEPLCIRQGNKQTPSDTNRSNYGDSAAEILSEVSSVVRKEEEEGDDADEETFYMKWIEQEKKLKEERSKINLPCLKVPSSSNFRMTDKVSTIKGSTTKSTSRLTSRASKSSIPRLTPIDMPLSKRTPSPKSSHYCISEKSSSSKAELISKAKTYGQLANSRNLFKMKLQSQNKLSAPSFNKNFEYLKSQTHFPNQDDSCSEASDDRSEVKLPFVSMRIRKRSEEAFKLMEKEERRKNSDLLLPLINFGNPGKRFEFRSKS